jgi:alkylation response protein AidB-like acyl-CoA dehydrogenase
LREGADANAEPAVTNGGDGESVEEFAARARRWLADHMPRTVDGASRFRPVHGSDDEELAQIARARDLQGALFDGGFAGICVPRAYGGQGLTAAHQAAFNREIRGYEYPAQVQVPTLTPCMALILEFGTGAQKERVVPPILRGETLWMQLLSEPGGGSDLAAVLTTAVRDGDEWVLNGSKIWTTGAWWADWALCLARTNWDVPKHRGLSVFMLPIHQPGLEVHRIEMLNGSREFCQEFLTDVRVPDTMRLGEVDEGWTVAVRWMYHERTIAAGSQYVTTPAGQPAVALDPTGGPPALLPVLRERGVADDAKVRELLGESLAGRRIGDALSRYVSAQIRTRAASEQQAALTRLWYGVTPARDSTIAFELAGPAAVAWSDEERALGDIGIRFLMRQVSCIAGGTTEMAKNAISERVLGFPREPRADVDIPFRDVPRGPAPP